MIADGSEPYLAEILDGLGPVERHWAVMLAQQLGDGITDAVEAAGFPPSRGLPANIAALTIALACEIATAHVSIGLDDVAVGKRNAAALVDLIDHVRAILTEAPGVEPDLKTVGNA